MVQMFVRLESRCLSLLWLFRHHGIHIFSSFFLQRVTGKPATSARSVNAAGIHDKACFLIPFSAVTGDGRGSGHTGCSLPSSFVHTSVPSLVVLVSLTRPETLAPSGFSNTQV